MGGSRKVKSEAKIFSLNLLSLRHGQYITCIMIPEMYFSSLVKFQHFAETWKM